MVACVRDVVWSAGGAGSQLQQQQLQSIPRSHHKLRFKHVRFNRMHVRLTYDGPPIRLNDFRLVSASRLLLRPRQRFFALCPGATASRA